MRGPDTFVHRCEVVVRGLEAFVQAGQPLVRGASATVRGLGTLVRGRGVRCLRRAFAGEAAFTPITGVSVAAFISFQSEIRQQGLRRPTPASSP